MKKIIATALLLFASNIFAADVIEFKQGVTFDHKRHQNKNVGNCSYCHEDNVGKIVGFGKEWAHGKCILCHDLLTVSEHTNCGVCHMATRVGNSNIKQ